MERAEPRPDPSLFQVYSNILTNRKAAYAYRTAQSSAVNYLACKVFAIANPSSGVALALTGACLGPAVSHVLSNKLNVDRNITKLSQMLSDKPRIQKITKTITIIAIRLFIAASMASLVTAIGYPIGCWSAVQLLVVNMGAKLILPRNPFLPKPKPTSE